MLTGNAAPALRSIAVVGSGVVARTAALALARAVPGATVTLVPAPIDPAALADWFPTLFARSRDVPALWGTSSEALLRAGIATPRLAAQFDDWGDSGRWLHPEGIPTVLPGVGSTHARWSHAAARADVPPFADLFPATAMLAAGTFAIDPPAPLAEADYALYLNPRRLVEWLTPRLRAARVTMASAPLASVHVEGQHHVTALHLRDATSLTSDLIVDASGPAAIVASAFEGGWHDWRTLLPEDRLLVRTATHHVRAGLDQYRLLPCGWQASWPFPTRAYTAIACRSTDDQAHAAVDPGDDGGTIPFEPGRRELAWRGNCVAIGEAAAQLGPLRLAGFTLAQAQLSLLLDLLPARDMPRSIIAAYNTRTGQRADRLRDWIAAHRCNGLLPGRADVAPVLAATLARFRRNGGLPHKDEESVSDAAWQAVLTGQGIPPHHAVPPASVDDPQRFGQAAHAAVARLTAAARSLPEMGFQNLMT